MSKISDKHADTMLKCSTFKQWANRYLRCDDHSMFEKAYQEVHGKTVRKKRISNGGVGDVETTS